MDAKTFAINAHKGQVRKVEPDKPLVIHPINVANILKQYGYNNEVVSAGYLHDVVEDTKYTLEDIKKFFGENIYKLVKNATDNDKTLSWEDRKKSKIDKVKNLDLNSKALICADKISNLEDLINLSGKLKQHSFTSLKRGFDKQKWYYESIYQSLIYDEEENIPIFIKLKELIDKMFYSDFTKISEEEKMKYQKREIKKLASVLEEDISIDGNLEEIRTAYIEKLNEIY